MEGLTAHRIAAAFERAGMPAADVPDRTGLVTSAWDEFVRATGHAPAWAWWIPGRIEVFGKHTDYAGGRSLVAAVPRGFAFVAAPRLDRVLTAHDARWQAAMQMAPADEAAVFTGWNNYVAVVARRLARNFPGAELGADIAFASDLPRAAGVSSSSALVVGMASALIRRAGLEHRPEWGANITSRLDLAGYLGAVENGLTFRGLAGTSGVGTRGGTEDHTAILNCRADAVSAFSYIPVCHVGDASLPAAWRFVVMSSGVEAAKAGAARGRYNRASLATQALVAVWRAHAGGDPATLASALATGDVADRRAALTAAIDAHPHPDFTPDELRRRLAHFIAEDARVPIALDAFARADRDVLRDLAAATQDDAERLLQNQVPQTSALVRLALEEGAFAASSFGAGFGGSVWALVEARHAAGFVDRLRRRYLDRFTGLESVAAFVARPAPAATEISLTE